MIKALLIEDEKGSAERLHYFLEADHQYSIQLLAWKDSVPRALEFLRKEKVDLVFLDVELGTQTGFDLLSQLGQIDFQIIFTTAHQEYALQAIKHAAMDYLLKPIDREELKLAVEKVRKEKGKSVDALEKLLKQFHFQEKLGHKIALPSLVGIEYVPVEEILRCQADINYTHFYLKNGRKITVSKTLKEFEIQLLPHGFFRVHNSHLINLAEVKFYQKGKGGALILSDGSEVEVASRRKEELMQILGKS
ncbi:MAG: LytTR family DNA-binding domain-containing protein [Cyclobacteriaceae bacterium]|nr:LytTR family DNA-binding domain-containing protein [Cyclobacteriaceae bacterium]MDX5466496.1 LytTR family DNA-binding domain-containing protein [Cyclobacteriaceae bacterium]